MGTLIIIEFDDWFNITQIDIKVFTGVSFIEFVMLFSSLVL